MASLSFLPSVISGSTTRRSSFAFGRVVRMVSCRSSETAMLRSMRMPMRAVARQLAAGEMVTHETFALSCSRSQITSPRSSSCLQARRRPAVEAHAEHQAVALQHFLDLGERLLAEVRRAQQLDFRALHEVADVVDVLGLEAVGAAHGELELVDRAQQDRIELHLGDLGRRPRPRPAGRRTPTADP